MSVDRRSLSLGVLNFFMLIVIVKDKFNCYSFPSILYSLAYDAISNLKTKRLCSVKSTARNYRAFTSANRFYKRFIRYTFLSFVLALFSNGIARYFIAFMSSHPSDRETPSFHIKCVRNIGNTCHRYSNVQEMNQNARADV